MILAHVASCRRAATVPGMFPLPTSDDTKYTFKLVLAVIAGLR
jgi:hypothetical protein